MLFQIQIPTEVIKNPKITHDSFLVYCKLVQHYYVCKDKNHTLQIDHKKFMYFSNIKSNQTFKKCMSQLYEYGLVMNKIDSLPRTGVIEIELNSKYVTNKKDFPFTQLPHWLLDKCTIDVIGNEGLRLIYYLKSHINNGGEFCYSSRETISGEIGSNPKTVDKYTNILKKNKFIKIIKHQLHDTGKFEDQDEFGTQWAEFIKYNNHYYIRFDKFDEIHSKLKREI